MALTDVITPPSSASSATLVLAVCTVTGASFSVPHPATLKGDLRKDEPGGYTTCEVPMSLDDNWKSGVQDEATPGIGREDQEMSWHQAAEKLTPC